jgi:hypothetical protein
MSVEHASISHRQTTVKENHISVPVRLWIAGSEIAILPTLSMLATMV